MPACVLRYCKNSTRNVNKRSGITFHRFPHNREARQEWIKFVRKDRREDQWMPSEYSSICSVHFPEDQTYATKNGRRFLKKTAVPKVLSKSSSDVDKLESVTKSKRHSDFLEDKDPLEPRYSPTPSNLSENDLEDLSDVDAEKSETNYKQKVNELKKQVEKLQQQLSKKDNEIVNLKKANSWLSVKNNTLKTVLLKMKRKIIASKAKRKGKANSEDD